MSSVRRDWLTRPWISYGTAVVAVAAGFGLRRALTAYVGESLPTYITFYPAVMATSLLAGLRPGLLATALTVAVVDCWIASPRELLFRNSSAEIAAMILFSIMGGAICALTELYRRNRRKAAAYDRQQAVREANERYELVLAGAEAGIWDWDVVHHKVAFSPQWKAMRGFAENEIIDAEQEWSGSIHPDDAPRVMASVQAHLEGKTAFFAEEYRVRRKDGSWRWIADRGVARRDSSGRAVRMAGSETDITERKQAEAALRASEQQLRQARELLEAVTGGAKVLIAAVDQDMRYTFFNQQHHEELRRLTGKETAIGMSLKEALADMAEERDKALAVWRRALGGETVVQTLAFGEPGRYRRWYSTHHAPIRDAAGQIVGAGEVTSDITELAQTRDALRTSESHFRQVAESLPQLVWTCRADGFCDYLGPQWVNYTGKPEAPQLGYGWLDQVHPDDRDRVRAAWEITAAKGEDFRIEFRIRRHDGAYRWFRTLAVPLRDETGRIVRWFGSNTEIQDLLEVQSALRESEQRMQQALRVSRSFTFEWQPASDQVRRSASCATILGLPGEAAVKDTGQAFFQRIHPDDRDRFVQLVEGLSPGHGSYQIEYRVVRPDGTVAVLEEVGQGEFGDAGRLVRLVGVSTDITARKQAEDAVRRAHDRLVLAQRSAGAGTWEWDVKTGKLDWSPELFHLFGLDPARAEATFDTWRAAIHPEDLALATARIEAAIRTRSRLASDYRILLPTGEDRWIRALGEVAFDPSGQPLQMAGICLDVTQRRQAETALARQREELQTILDATPAFIFFKDCENRFVRVNHAFASIMGVPKEELEGRSLFDLYPREQAEAYWKDDQAVMASGQPKRSIVEPMRTPTGERWVQTDKVPCRDADGKVIGVIGFSVDITERREAEEALRKSREDLAHAQEVGQIGSWRLDTRRNVLTWSDENHHIFGVPKGTAMTYETFLGVVHPDDRQYVDTQWQAALRGQPYDIEHRLIIAGEVKWVREKAYLEFDQGGALLGGFGITQDVTERKRAEAALVQARADLERKVQERTAELRRTTQLVEGERQRFRQVLDKLPAYLVLLSPNHQVPFANRFFEERFGKAEGRRCYECLFERNQPCDNCQSFKALETGKPHQWEWTGPDGRHYEIFDSPFTDLDGSSLVLEVGLDVSDRKAAEQAQQRLRNELDRFSRITTAGQLAASLAHELNQPLGAIVCNIQAVQNLMARETPDYAEIRETLQDIEADGKRAGEIIHQLRGLFQKTVQPSVALHLNQVLRKTLDLLHSEFLLKGLAIELDLESSLPPIRGREVELQQVILNLVTNAIEAMGSALAGARRLLVRTRRDGPAALRFSVRDSGPGLEPESLQRIFEPFFSTKANGMGMGLAISHSIVEAHGGRLWAENHPEGGAIFHVTLPISSDTSS